LEFKGLNFRVLINFSRGFQGDLLIRYTNVEVNPALVSIFGCFRLRKKCMLRYILEKVIDAQALITTSNIRKNYSSEMVYIK